LKAQRDALQKQFDAADRQLKIAEEALKGLPPVAPTTKPPASEPPAVSAEVSSLAAAATATIPPPPQSPQSPMSRVMLVAILALGGLAATFGIGAWDTLWPWRRRSGPEAAARSDSRNSLDTLAHAAHERRYDEGLRIAAKIRVEHLDRRRGPQPRPQARAAPR
jgi:hypothetical protein